MTRDPKRLSELQTLIMKFFNHWEINNCPLPMHEIMSEMDDKGFNKTRTIRAVRGLVKKRYIRKSFDRSSRSSYVKIKNI